jgi:hypothetical protein
MNDQLDPELGLADAADGSHADNVAAAGDAGTKGAWGLYCAAGAVYTLKLVATRRFWFLSLLLLGIVAMLVIMRIYYPDIVFYSAALSTWCLFFAIAIILSPACSLISWVALIALEISFGRIKLYQLKLFYLRAARPRLSYLLWSIGLLVDWQASLFLCEVSSPNAVSSRDAIEELHCLLLLISLFYSACLVALRVHVCHEEIPVRVEQSTRRTPSAIAMQLITTSLTCLTLPFTYYKPLFTSYSPANVFHSDPSLIRLSVPHICRRSSRATRSPHTKTACCRR